MLQKPYTTLESYYDFWEHVEHASHATYFFTFLAQKLLTADKKNAQIALGVTSSSVLATLLLLALYYPVSVDDPMLKSLLKKQGIAPGARKTQARAAAASASTAAASSGASCPASTASATVPTSGHRRPCHAAPSP